MRSLLEVRLHCASRGQVLARGRPRATVVFMSHADPSMSGSSRQGEPELGPNPPSLESGGAEVVRVDVIQLDPDLPLPAYGRPGDAGMDLRSRIDVVVDPGCRVLVPTGLALALPEGFVALVHPRSGLAFTRGLTVVNTPGTVDAGFRGEVQVALVNLDPDEPVSISRGDRVAQLVIQRFAHAVWNPVPSLPDSVRGGGGFGSTGVGAS